MGRILIGVNRFRIKYLFNINKVIKLFIKQLVTERARINIRLFIYKLKSIFYTGNQFHCVCCNKSFSKFLTHGNIPRKNTRCPYCGSLERTRLVQLYLEKETTIFEEGKSVLHFAPEQMLEKRFAKIYTKYVSADINPALAKVVVDITQIPYSDNYFDYVICSHVLGHVPDEVKAIDEIYRVLKPAGRAIILTLIDNNSDITFEDAEIKSPEERLNQYGESDLVRLHGRDFGKRLTRKGIKIKAVDYRLQFSDIEQQRQSLRQPTSTP